MKLTYKGKTFTGNFIIHFPRTKQTYYCTSVSNKKGLLTVKNPVKYNHDSFTSKLEKVPDFKVFCVPAIINKVEKYVEFF